MKEFKVTYGYDLEHFETEKEVEDYMLNIVEVYKELNPRKVYDDVLQGNKKVRVVVYEYRTLYRETFIIEERDV